MDTSDLVIQYSEVDFAGAIRALLPAGEYWQEANNQELTSLIIGMGAEFKTINDEVQLALLTDFSQQLFGWKLSDYQALLIRSGGNGVVTDDSAEPNLIFVSLDNNVRCEKAWFEFERVRLPHTQIEWIYNASLNPYTQVANARHVRNLHKHEVSS